MKARFRQGVIALACCYAAGISLWFVLHLWLGDSVWWLALLNSFVPYFFVPVLLILPFAGLYRRRTLWISLCLPALIFIWLYGGLFLPLGKGNPSAEPTLTVMTFNVWGGSHQAETAEVIIDNGYPDIVVLQELTPEMQEILLEVLGDRYPYALLDAGEVNRGMGVLSRYPLREVADAESLYALDWELQVVEVQLDGQMLTVYNCHPHSSNVLAYLEEGSAIAASVTAGFRNREMIARALLADIERRQTPVIVAGDLNSPPQSAVYRLLTQRLTNSHAEAGWGLGHTFPAYQGSYRGIPILARQMRLDVIFYTPELQALRSSVSATYGESDHLPVMAELRERR